MRALEDPSPPGSITIDGVDIARIDPVDLRRRVITLMPQSPAVLEGTVRDNLDVEGTRTDYQLREVMVSRGNLSAGQIQLLALARALLTNASIVILDEATAAMDSPTRNFIQNVVKEHFRTHTVITITHHIESALEHDKVLVLHDGQVAGYDSPGQLLKDENKIPCDLVQKRE